VSFVGRAGILCLTVATPSPAGPAPPLSGWPANLTIGGGPAPVCAYIEGLLPDILGGTIEPGRIFDRTVDLDGVPDSYRAMDEREALKVIVEP
jgi:threonine dehydrogenase-like Zn-dependent dehydrogenase